MTTMLKSVQICIFAGLVFMLDASSSHAEEIAPATTNDSDRNIGIYVDTSSIEEDSREQFEYVITTHLIQKLEDAGYTVVDGNVSLILQVRLAPLQRAEEREYGLYFDFIRGASSRPAIQWVHCAKCTQVQFTKQFDDAAELVLAELENELESSTSHPDEPGDGDGDPVEPATVKPIGPLGGAGIGIAALGLGATIAGAVELSRGKIYDEPTLTFGERTYVDHTIPGAVLVGLGAAAFAAGTAMLVVDVVARNKKQKNRAAHPMLGPGVVGVGYIQRF
jgi:hypothetical protein